MGPFVDMFSLVDPWDQSGYFTLVPWGVPVATSPPGPCGPCGLLALLIYTLLYLYYNNVNPSIGLKVLQGVKFIGILKVKPHLNHYNFRLYLLIKLLYLDHHPLKSQVLENIDVHLSDLLKSLKYIMLSLKILIITILYLFYHNNRYWNCDIHWISTHHFVVL